MKLSISILSSENRLECIKKLNKTNIDYYHIDVMDGIFVDNYQMPLQEVSELSKYTNKPLDIHLMVKNPSDYIKQINYKNVEYITFHIETEENILENIEILKEKGYKVGLSIKPNTKIDELLPYLKYIDLVLIMSVEPGQGGQEFIMSSLEKIKNLKNIITNNDYKIKIEVDGGINESNIILIKNEKTDIIVSGSYIIKNENYQNQIDKLKI